MPTVIKIWHIIQALNTLKDLKKKKNLYFKILLAAYAGLKKSYFSASFRNITEKKKGPSCPEIGLEKNIYTVLIFHGGCT